MSPKAPFDKATLPNFPFFPFLLALIVRMFRIFRFFGCVFAVFPVFCCTPSEPTKTWKVSQKAIKTPRKSSAKKSSLRARNFQSQGMEDQGDSPGGLSKFCTFANAEINFLGLGFWTEGVFLGFLSLSPQIFFVFIDLADEYFSLVFFVEKKEYSRQNPPKLSQAKHRHISADWLGQPLILEPIFMREDLQLTWLRIALCMWLALQKREGRSMALEHRKAGGLLQAG